MLDNILNNIEKQHDAEAVGVVCLGLLRDLKHTYYLQKDLLKIITEKKFKKIDKEIKNYKKKPNPGFRFFNAVYTGPIDKKKMPNGNGILFYESRNKEYPDENDFYVGEFKNGTKTGIGKYTYFNDRNIAKHPFTIPYYVGEWSGDQYYGLGHKIIDQFDDLMTFEGDFRNNLICGFGKFSTKTKDGEIDMIGYFFDSKPILYGVELHKDKNGQVIENTSGLYEYDREKNTKKNQFPFLSSDTWKTLDIKGYKREKIKVINSIHKDVVANTIDQIEIMSNKFKSKKLSLKIKHMNLLFIADAYWEKNFENKDFKSFVDTQNVIKNSLDKCMQFKDLENVNKLIDESTKALERFKKILK